MSLVTVQRSPSNSNASSTVSTLDNDEETEERLKRGCESFFAMKGAALVLPHSKDTQRPIKKHPVVGELQTHLQCIFWILRPEDTIKMAVRLESSLESVIRYMVLVSCLDTHQNTEETIILGVDITDEKASIGLVLPIWADSHILMDGDGGFTVTTGDDERVNNFKPVSVQAMWSALQALYKTCDLARQYNYYRGGLHMTWIGYYQSIRPSPISCLKEWDYLPEIISTQSEEINYFYQREGRYCPTEDELIRRFIFVKLRDIMIHTDLETATCKLIRMKLEEELGKELKEYRAFIDKQILLIVGQLDSSSKIFDHVYLGSEWNASNLDELEENGIGYILNITKECDNFFPDLFQYCNIRLYDEESSELLKHWDTTFRFLNKVKEAGSKALVHCKMGVSRSASTVIAYAMKEYEMTLDKALAYVKEKRPVVKPNKAFMIQLQTYEGILEASRQRHRMFRSKSESSLNRTGSSECLNLDRPLEFTGTEAPGAHTLPRNRSWCVKDSGKTEIDSPQGAVGGTDASFYIGPDGHHLGVGQFEGATGTTDEMTQHESNEDKCSEISVPVPIVRPSSIVKLQKEGALAEGEVPFLIQPEQPPPPSPTEPSSTVLPSDVPSENLDTEQQSTVEDTLLNTNNNSANELSFNEDEYQRISVKSKVTEFESNALAIFEPVRDEASSGEEGDGKEDAYTREAIPWSPGTVLRQKQEIEEKMSGSGSPTNSMILRFEDEMEEGEDNGGEDNTDVQEGEGAEKVEEKKSEDEQSLSTHELSKLDELASSSCKTESTLLDSSDKSLDLLKCSVVVTQDVPNTDLDVPDVNRDVQGLTDSTNSKEITQGESCNLPENVDCEPMDVDEPLSPLKTGTVYTTSGEQIETALGLVERQKREFEQKKMAGQISPIDKRAPGMDNSGKEAMDLVVSPSYEAKTEDPDTGLTCVQPMSCDQSASCDQPTTTGAPKEEESSIKGDGYGEQGAESTQTAYQEEGSTWKVGDVLRHRKTFEEKMETGGSPPSPTKRLSGGTSSRLPDLDKDRKLTEEELKKIKDLEKIPLEVPTGDGESCQEENGDTRQGMIAVAEQIKMLELKRCKSIAKMSNEKIRRRYARPKSDDGDSKSSIREQFNGSSSSSSSSSSSLNITENYNIEKPVKNSLISEISSSSERLRPDSTISTSQGAGPEQRLSPDVTIQDEPLVELNPELVKLFTGQLGGNISGELKSASDSQPRSEARKDAGVVSGRASRSRRQHGPSHPLNALGRGKGSGRAPSSRGKFYSTM